MTRNLPLRLPFDLADNPLWQRIVARAAHDRPFAQRLARWIEDQDASTVYLRDELCEPCRKDDRLTYWRQFAAIDSAMHLHRHPELRTEDI